MKWIMILVYVAVGTLVLFQGSRLIDASIEKNLTDLPVNVKIRREKASGRPITMEDEYNPPLFQSPLFTVTQPQEAAADGSPGETAPSALLKNYELNGIILLSDNKSIALIRKARERASNAYRVGDMLDNYEIVGIERYRVLVSDGLRKSELPMYRRDRESASTKRDERDRRDAKDLSPSHDTNAKQIKKVLSRSDVQAQVFDKVNEILTKIAISPYMVNGQMEGMRLIRVPNDSIVYELGGRSGDIIRRVNGHELTQIDQMYKLWDNIKDDSLITVDLERKNQLFTYNFEIRE
jgi:type II secretion system protein C